VFHCYREGYRFAKLACDLVEKHGFIASRAKVYTSMGLAAFWMQPMDITIDFYRAAFRAAIETGDLTFACHNMVNLLAGLLMRNDPLDAVWRESEMALDFVRKARFRDGADGIVIDQRFIATMQGRTATFSTFSGVPFDEAAFEAELTEDRSSALVCWYWIFKLQAQFLAGEYGAALAAAQQAKPLLWALVGMSKLVDYFYYTGLTVAALYEKSSADEQSEWRDLLTAHREQLREWAETYPPTFSDKHALVSAEIARLEKRPFDAMQLYEQAIQSAHQNGFVQNEALAHEVAARFYAMHGSETSARAYLCKARNCYERWGALGKVKQLDELYPHLHEERLPASTTSTIGTPVRQLDVETVVKASQALSSEIFLPKLIEKLMRIAVEHAGAERGLLILLRGDEPQIEAEATGPGATQVTMRQTAVTTSDLPRSALDYVIRTRERLVLDDASVRNLYSEDEYVRAKRARSILCLPIVKQTKLVGAVYLENNLTPRAFTSDRVAVLELLASQAAISLENASLYSDLQRSEALLAEAQRLSRTGSFGWNVSSGEIFWSEETYKIFDFDRAVKPTLELVFQRVYPDDKSLVQQTIDRGTNEKTSFDFEHRLLMPDGSVKYVHVLARALEPTSGDLEFVGAVTDVTERKQSEEEREKLHEVEADLARINRVTMMGELAASLAHEIKQPIAAAGLDAGTCLRWLGRDQPDLDEARKSASRIIQDVTRASEIIGRVRSLYRKGEPQRELINVNEIIREMIDLLRGETRRHSISTHTELADDLPHVSADRVQLQQVLMNLMLNAVDAMKESDGAGKLTIKSRLNAGEQLLISVSDTGPGFPPGDAERIFDAFFTTKSQGTGMGLSISRSIIEAHGGRLWAAGASGGATFQFTLPAMVAAHI
jgi:signal transduction histidine kinase/GAF domain-containing protein